MQGIGELARTTYRIVSWGEDADGELYFLDFTGGGIHQLVKAPAAKAASRRFPRKLSETGIFASTKDHKVAPGVIPYSVNAQLWGDHAYKERFIAIPGNGQIGFDEITYPQPSPGAPPGWRFPDGTVLVKTFGMEMERGNPKSRKRLETRLLHFQQFPGTQEYGDQYWRGYTYVWNDEQTDAELLDEKGARQAAEDQGRRQDGRAELPLPEPGRVYAVPHQRRQVRPRRQHAANEPRPRIYERRHRQPAGDAGAHRPVHEEAAADRRTSCRSWPITTTTSCRSTCGPARICTPTAPIAT